MRLYPLFADLAGRRVLVVGGGSVAERKVRMLLDSQAQVELVAERLSPWLKAAALAQRLSHRALTFCAQQLDGVWLVIAATDDAALHRRIAEAATQRQLWVNVVDDAALSSFQVPAVIDRAPLLIAVSSGGSAPMLARWVRERVERLLEPSIGELAKLLERWRARIRARLPDLAQRRSFYSSLIDGEVAQQVNRGRTLDAETALAAQLSQLTLAPGSGEVILVGAGPGAAGLLTLDALRALQRADVILHDHLVSAEVLELARRDAERIDVGKQGGGRHTPQHTINDLLIAHARRGQVVVRLKGGDPFVFGRGGEELQALRAAGIAYSVVPGITAANACAAYAGIPLTHREHAQSLRLVTAHSAQSIDHLDWASMAAERQTLAIYMAGAVLQPLRDRLIAHGRSACTPVALIENGTRRNQRVITGTLAELPQLAAAYELGSPALLIVGDVAGLATQLAWFGAAPLQGLPEPGLALAA